MKNLILFFILLVSFQLFSQEWKEMSLAGNSFIEIQKAMNLKFEDKSALPGDSNYDLSFKQYKKWEDYWSHHQTSEGEIGHSNLMSDAWKEHMLMKRKSTSDWTYAGPFSLPESSLPKYPGAGRINAIAFDPDNSSTIWVGSPAGGIWKSTDDGKNWEAFGDQLPNMSISDIVIEPNNSDVIYIATGDAPGSQNYSIGVLKSMDGGVTWNSTGLTFPDNKLVLIYDLYLDTSQPSTLIASASNGLHKTIDSGNTWLLIDTLPSYQVIAKTSNSEILYSSGKDMIRISYDSGDNWLPIGPILNGPRVKIAVSAVNPEFIIALDAKGNLFETHDEGLNWKSVSFGVPYNSQNGYNMAIAVSPIDTNILLVGGVHAWRTTDGGLSWDNYLNGNWKPSDPFFYVHSDHHVFKFLPGDESNILFSGNDGGLNKGDVSLNDPWNDLSQGLLITQYYGIGTASSQANLLIAGAQDNDVNYTDGINWYGVNNNSDGIDGMYNYLNPKTVYAASQSRFLTRTHDQWISVDTISVPGNASFTWPIAMNRINPNTIYGGTNEIYVSYNSGDNWSKLTSNQSFNSSYGEIGLSPIDTNTIYASYSSVLLSTTDGGQNWNYIAIPSSNTISGIAVSDTSAQTVYISLSGYSDGEKVFVSTDGGKNWTNLSASIPNIPINCIVAQSGSNEDLYIGTNLGVFHKDNTQSDFLPFSSNLPNVIVKDLEIHYETNKLKAATFGRGVWESDLASMAVSVKENLANTFGITIFPNPINDNGQLEISIPQQDSIFNVIVFNLNGGILYREYNLPNGNHVLDFSKFDSGVYFVKAYNGTGSSVHKVIKK